MTRRMGRNADKKSVECEMKPFREEEGMKESLRVNCVTSSINPYYVIVM